MNQLPINIIKNITDCLSLHDYKQLSFCSKSLYTDIMSLYQNDTYINKQFLDNKNIFKIFELINTQHDKIQNLKKSSDSALNFDIQWSLERFHSERKKLSVGLTFEQQCIVNFEYSPGDIILIQAFAGTGKTTTLINVAKKHNDKKILYLTFNKNLADNANKIDDIDHVTICTMHSLALANVDPNNEFQIGKISLKYIENVFDIDRLESSIVRNILNNFFSSTSKFISKFHTSSMNIKNEDHYIEISNNIWEHMKNKLCKMPHDGYLKLYQLKNIKLDFDIIMLDEAQDSTECMLQIIKKQKHCSRYLVGDSHQQIYGFRNVCNIFSNDTNGVKKFKLSQSFRYGYQIAHLSNLFLNTFKNETNKIYSHGLNTNIVLNSKNFEKYTIICRTNNGLLKECFDLNNNIKCSILGKDYNFDKECMYAEAFHSITMGIVPIPEKLQEFISIEEMQKYFQNLNNYKWLSRINLFLEYGFDIIEKYRNLQQQIVSVNDADIILTTAHQAKGLEFDNIKLCNDFIPLTTFNKTIYSYKSKSAMEAYNILYVAFTRGMKNVILNKELYLFLKYLKGQRVLSVSCPVCNKQYNLNEDGISCIGFNSKPIYTKLSNCCCF